MRPPCIYLNDTLKIAFSAVASTVLCSVYGYRLNRSDDPFFVEANIAVGNLGKAHLATSTCIVSPLTKKKKIV